MTMLEQLEHLRNSLEVQAKNFLYILDLVKALENKERAQLQVEKKDPEPNPVRELTQEEYDAKVAAGKKTTFAPDDGTQIDKRQTDD